MFDLQLIPKLIFPCARPEPVEGYLGALEDILQQVQDERIKKFNIFRL